MLGFRVLRFRVEGRALRSCFQKSGFEAWGIGSRPRCCLRMCRGTKEGPTK